MRPADAARPVVLLLPEPLEAFSARALAEELLRVPAVVAVDPPRATYPALARLPGAFSAAMGIKQARRLVRRLPGAPAAVVIFAPAQYPLARGLLAEVPDAELWYGPADGAAADGGRFGAMHELAGRRAALRFDPLGPADALWERLAGLGRD